MSAPTFEWFPPEDSRAKAFLELRALPDASPESLRRGVTCGVAIEDGAPRARCTVESTDALHGVDGVAGVIGHYEALDPEAGTALLEAAKRRLVEGGASELLGPMNGNTWYRYRLALPRERSDPSFDPPWFMGEPQNPDDYPEHFRAAGFREVAFYESQIDEELRPLSEAARASLSRAKDLGARFEPLDPDRFDETLRELYTLSIESFSRNPYYAHIDLEGFRALYAPFRGRLDPDFITLVRLGDEAIGYVFAYPDLLSVEDGRPRRLVIKTLAVHPAHRNHRLGTVLVAGMQEIARQRGFDAVIHALMHVSNVSTRISDRQGGLLFRRYALFGWRP